jgi:hypothetical protein
MTTLHRPAAAPVDRARRALTECIVALAGTPDDSSWVEPELVGIAHLTAELMAPHGYTSVIAYRAPGYRTVASSGDVPAAADAAQCTAGAGPGVASIERGSPVGVQDIGLNMAWPQFRAAAAAAGLRTALSVPLFAGCGTPVAALNVYSSEAALLAPLTTHVVGIYEAGGSSSDRIPHGLSDGAAQLLDGLRGAFAVRAVIQQAVGIIAGTDRTADSAYWILRLRAAESGVTLVDTASAVIAEAQG